MGKDLIKDVVDTPQSGVVVTMSPETLISQAINAKVPVETMEKLLAMRRELKDEQAREAFARDFAAFQGECPVITKSNSVLNKDKKTVRYHYAPLDVIVRQVQEVITKYGFSYTVQTINERDPDGQRSVCTVHHIEGHSRSSEFWAPVDHDAYMSDQQKWASASTYGKRYAFCNAFGILTGDEDNDAQNAGNGVKTPPPEQPLVNGSAMKQLHTQILKDISDPHFAGHIEFEGKQIDLDVIRVQVNEFLTEDNSLNKMTKAGDRIARMLLVATGADVEHSAIFNNPKDEGQLSDDEVQDIFGGEVVDVETEGNLSQ